MNNTLLELKNISYKYKNITGKLAIKDIEKGDLINWKKIK